MEWGRRLSPKRIPHLQNLAMIDKIDNDGKALWEHCEGLHASGLMIAVNTN